MNHQQLYEPTQFPEQPSAGPVAAVAWEGPIECECSGLALEILIQDSVLGWFCAPPHQDNYGL